MSARVRVSAVSFLNARPLVHGLDRHPDLFEVSFDLPSTCAARLHAGAVDLGLIPAIEYLNADYRLVPGMAIGSDGPILSVAVFTTRPIDQVRRIALDSSSRTSATLCRILCARHWDIAPTFVPAAPRLEIMLREADAALVIGDPAFEIDPVKRGVTKIDLGAEWKSLTGLPFVYAMWVGREGAASPAQCRALQRARDNGLAHLGDIAREVAAGDATLERRSLEYLRDNLKYGLGPGEAAGLRRFHELSAELGLVPELKPLRFYQS